MIRKSTGIYVIRDNGSISVERSHNDHSTDPPPLAGLRRKIDFHQMFFHTEILWFKNLCTLNSELALRSRDVESCLFSDYFETIYEYM